MNKFSTLLAASALALTLGTTVVMAQTTQAPAADTAKKAPAAKSTTAKSTKAKSDTKSTVSAATKAEISQKCSAEADAQGLKGKKRKSFHASCKTRMTAEAAKKS